MDNSRLPFVTALCPTYRHPTLLASSLALWLAQDYPLDRRDMVILDDGQTFYTQSEQGWTLWSASERCPSLPSKYNKMLFDLMNKNTDIVLIWEDDDIYAPGYIQWHVNSMYYGRYNPRNEWIDEYTAEFSKPSRVLSDYHYYERLPKNMLQEEDSGGRFHSSMAFTADLIKRVGGWVETDAKTFDQQLMQRLEKEARGIADPYKRSPHHQFVYGWETGYAHCQSTMHLNDRWYQEAPKAYKEVPFVGKLVPRYDDRTLTILEKLGVTPKYELLPPDRLIHVQ